MVRDETSITLTRDTKDLLNEHRGELSWDAFLKQLLERNTKVKVKLRRKRNVIKF